MSKVITFSRKYPRYHHRNGEATFFVEKFLNSKSVDYASEKYLQKLLVLNTKNIANGKLCFEDIESFWISLQKVEGDKGHTIRGGYRFESGECFSPRCWFGRPYFDPQIIFYDDTSIENTWKFEIKDGCFYLNGLAYVFDPISKNDGFEYLPDLLGWFKYPRPFEGQIICWSPKITY